MDWTALILQWIISYGAPVVGAILLLGGMGVPLPSTLVVIAAGAFIRQGVLNIYTTPLLGIVCVVLGDSIVFGMGRFASPWIEKHLGKTTAWHNAKDSFEHRGGTAIYLTRWLITPLALPTNLIAGSSGYAFPKMLAFDIAGELTWLALYGGLGYTFGAQWELITAFISNFSGLILSALAILTGIYLLIRFWRKPDKTEAYG